MNDVIDNCLKRAVEIVSGIPLDWRNIPENQREKAILVALHCCFNGPVGVNKKTTFPLVGEGTIKGWFGCSNSSWKGFCKAVAEIVTNRLPDLDCTQIRLNKKYWPL